MNFPIERHKNRKILQKNIYIYFYITNFRKLFSVVFIFLLEKTKKYRFFSVFPKPSLFVLSGFFSKDSVWRILINLQCPTFYLAGDFWALGTPVLIVQSCPWAQKNQLGALFLNIVCPFCTLIHGQHNNRSFQSSSLVFVND